jgi:hypothetical protein
MNTTHDWLPQNHEALVNQSTQTWDYLYANRDRLGFGATTLQGQWIDAAYSSKYTAFIAAFNDWKNPAERTPMKTSVLGETEKLFREAYRQLYTGFLKNNPLIADDDLLAMGLPTRHTGGNHPSPVETTYPDVDMDSSMIRRLTFHFFARGHKKSKAKPAGQHGAEIRWAKLDTPPTAIAELIHSAFDTHSPFTLEFEENERGKTVYFCLCWENTRGEKGPWSEIQSAIIP